MVLVDTHTHLYLDAFDNDREQSIQRAFDKGIKYQLLPNIDMDSLENMLAVCKKHSDICFPMIGLHPTSVKSYYDQTLDTLKCFFKTQKFYAIGETGIDLYWDKTLQAEQEKAFVIQMEWAVKQKLPLVIHSRKSMNEVLRLLKEFNNNSLTGVFHCFPGSVEQAQEVIEMGFKIGVGGVVTYKNSSLVNVIDAIDLKHILLETDAPFLPPVPYRGHRNESAYIYEIAENIAQIKNIPIEKVAEVTTENAIRLFNLPVSN